MALKDEQITFEEIDPEYAAFVEKFKPKKTTDDCYTPENIYNAIADWVVKEYGVDRDSFVRPFWPGGDYQRFDYPDGCVVVDNPPFSIRAEIIDFYLLHSVRFFLFSPSLTLLTPHMDVCYIVSDTDITYENRAIVRTAFVTNLDTEYVLRTAPDLMEAVRVENDRNTKKPELPKYCYPDHVVTAAIAQRWCHYGVDYRVRSEDAVFIRALDAQRAQGKSIFGSGLLLSERAAVERAAAERAAAERVNMIEWELSEREREIVRRIGQKKEAIS